MARARGARSCARRARRRGARAARAHGGARLPLGRAPARHAGGAGARVAEDEGIVASPADEGIVTLLRTADAVRRALSAGRTFLQFVRQAAASDTGGDRATAREPAAGRTRFHVPARPAAAGPFSSAAGGPTAEADSDAVNLAAPIPDGSRVYVPRVGETDVFEFARQCRELMPELPFVLLAYDTRELSVLKDRAERDSIDRIFVWLGDARVFLAIIKWAEDLKNALHDAELAGVRHILLIEDSVRFYSAYTPMLYGEIMRQTQTLMTEGVNRMQQLMRMRARPKVLLASSYEEAEEVYHASREHLLGIISDAARYPVTIDPGSDTDPSGVLFNQFRHESSVLLERLDREGFVIRHKEAVSFDISGKDGPKLASNLFFFRHWITFLQMCLRV